MIGTQITISANCSLCGKPMLTTWHEKSLFVFAHCAQLDCKNLGLRLIIEKASGFVIATDPPQYGFRGTPLFPMLADKDGKQVWPEQK